MNFQISAAVSKISKNSKTHMPCNWDWRSRERWRRRRKL